MVNGAKTRPRPITQLLFVAIILLSFGLRLYRIESQSLWNDEGTSVAVAQQDLAAIARDAAHDIHPPLYYWLLSAWVRLFGNGEAAVRSLSALLGVVLVALIYALGRLLGGRWLGLVAALLAAVNPFQVYYAQEARMYMLLAVLAAGAMLALARTLSHNSWAAWIALVLAEAAGLYTHYSFAFIILALNLAYLLWLALARRQKGAADQPALLQRVLNWILGQVGVVLLYLPWLPTAIRQVSTWPSPEQTAGFGMALADAWRWQVLGPSIETGDATVVLLVAALLAVVGLLSLGSGSVGKGSVHSGWAAGGLALWLALPLILMFALGLYREAYLKFLVVTSPAICLALAGGLLARPPGLPAVARYLRLLTHLLAALVLAFGTYMTLNNYYGNPQYARDDYRALVTYIDALSRPEDTILLNAPGQQEVFAYYYRGGLPVYPLPKSRPMDVEATESTLKELARPGTRVFAVLWATDESDPDRYIESWLDRHAYKAIDSWYGNVRLAAYAVPERTPLEPDRVSDVSLQDAGGEDEIRLLGYSLLGDRLAAGDIAQITLFWQAEGTPSRRYKVFVHILDESNQIAGQRDAEPGGGSRLTTLWAPGERVADNHGVPIHPATPPGKYRVEVGLYDAETGQRLRTPQGADQIWLDPLLVERPSAPAPAAALAMQHDAGQEFGDLSLLGYDVHRLGYAHQPDAPLPPGDILHVNLYWHAGAQLGGDWGLRLGLVDSSGQAWASVDAQPVVGYSTSHWQTGDVWRGQFNLAVPGDTPPGIYRLRVGAIAPDGTAAEPYLSDTLKVER